MFNNDETAKMQYEIEQNNEKIIDREIQQISRHLASMEELMELTKKVRNYRTEIYKIKLGLKNQLGDIYTKKNTKELKEMESRAEDDEKVGADTSVTEWIYNRYSLEDIYQRALIQRKFLNTIVIQVFKDRVSTRIRCPDKVRRFEIEEGVYNIEAYDVEGWKVTPSFFLKVFSAEDFREEYFNKSEKQLDDIANGKYVIRRTDYESNLEKIEELTKLEKEYNKRIILIRTSDILQYYEKELSYWQEMNLIKSIENSDSEHYFD